MTLAQFLRIARAQWLLIAAATALGALAGSAYSWSQTPIYQATAQIWVATRAGESSITTLSAGSTFSQQRVKSYAAIMTTPDVMVGVIAELGLSGVSPEQVAGQVTAVPQENTVLMDIIVRDTSPERARDIANSVAKQFGTFVTKLELPSGTGSSPVKISLTTPAVAPSTPVSPKPTFNFTLGLFLGLALGIGGVVLRDSLDRTIGTRHDVSALTGAPVLAAIVDDPDAKTAPLIIHDAFSPRAEAFRQLRTNIRFLSVDAEVRSLVVTSSMPGEGKSTTSANLAIALAQSGEKVVLIDADLRRPSISDMFMLPGGVGLTSVLLGDVPPAEAVEKWRDDLDLWILASGPIPPNPSELIGTHRMVEIVETLVKRGYMVIVDSPPLLPVTDATILARITAGALVVARVTSTRVDQLTAATETLRTAGAPILGMLVNRVPKTSNGYYSYGGYSAPGSGGYRPAGAPAAVPPLAEVTTGGPASQTAAENGSGRKSRRRASQAAPPPSASPAAPNPAPASAPNVPVQVPARVPVTTPAPPPPPVDLRFVDHGYTGRPSGQSSTNGQHTNGYPANGQQANGHHTNGHQANGYQANGHPNGHHANSHPADAQHANGQPQANGYAAPSRTGYDVPPTMETQVPQRWDSPPPPPSIQIDISEQLRQLGRREG